MSTQEDADLKDRLMEEAMRMSDRLIALSPEEGRAVLYMLAGRTIASWCGGDLDRLIFEFKELYMHGPRYGIPFVRRKQS